MIIRTLGDISDFSIHLNPITEDNIRLENGNEKKKFLSSYHEAEKSISTLAVMEEVSRSVDNYTVQLKKSKEERGLGLGSIHLNKSFEIFLANMFRPGNEIYLTSWSWDLSGEPVHVFPALTAKPEEVIFKMKEGTTREFIGTGINLFPKRHIVGGLSTRIQIWECDGRSRRCGKVITEIFNTIKTSKLNTLLTNISILNVTAAHFNLIKEAAFELGNLVGMILKGNSDDYVDCFEGYYPADMPWEAGEEKYDGFGCNIVLNKY
jgi:hypothetical protein